MTEATADLQKYLSERARRVYGSLGKQTSVPIEGLINLGSGTPDFLPPAAVFEAMEQAVRDHRIQYAAWSGIPELRAAIANKLRTENNVSYDPDSEIIVTGGAQEALMTTLMTLLDPGDEALTPSPNYDEYTRDANILGGALVPVPTTPQSGFVIDPAALEAAITPQSGFVIDPAALEAAITPRTKALVIVTPNNPTGTVLSESTLLAIAEIAIRHDLIVISDEIYEYYVFDGNKHVSMGSLPGMRERTVTINSFSKSFAMTGLRLGYIAAPAGLIEAMLPFHHAMMICANTITQYGGLAALRAPRGWFADVLTEYDRRRHLWMDTLKEIGLPYNHPQGAYYVFFDIRPTGLTSAQYVAKARTEARLVFQPGTIGGGAGEGFVRGALTKGSPDFETGLARLREFTTGLMR